VWSLEEEQVPERLLRHCQCLVGFIETELHINRSALIEEELTTTTMTTTTNDNAEAPINATTPSPPQRNVNCVRFDFTSQGQEFSFSIPSTHRIEHISDIKH